MLRTPDRVFVDVHSAVHSEPVLGHRGGPFIAYFSQAFALGNESAKGLIYGASPAALSQAGFIAAAGEPNTGEGRVGFLACRRDGPAVPSRYVDLCD